MINMIVAYDESRGIGRDGDLPWRPGEMREDMKRFRTLTHGATLIMGRRTLESIGMALPGRRNIVVSSRKTVPFEEVEVAPTVRDALEMSADTETFVIGGARVYEAALEAAERIYATEVHAEIDGIDTFFPRIDSAWTETVREPHVADESNRYPFDFVTYEKSARFVNLANARSESQREVMKKIEADGECPFCRENLEKHHTEEILREGNDWLLTPNRWPYEHTSTHMIAIPKYHAETLADLHDDSFGELLGHLKWAEKEFDVKSGAIAMRFGDAAGNGSSVRHLHVHFIVPDPEKPADAKVRFKIS